MVKRIVELPKNRINTREALVEFLASNGMTTFGANQMMFVNIPALGEYRSLQNAIDDGEWDTAWNVALMYLNGMFNA